MVVAASLELGNDEVYYQAYALHLQWNYFDHPPLVALLIRLSTFNLFFQHEFFIRLGPMICAAAGTWLIFKTGTLLQNQRTGWIAAILYNTSFYTSVIAGTFILPDSPHVLCWLLSMYLMIRILQKKQNENSYTLSFILLGICTGLCIMSKAQGVFLWIGFGGFILFHRRALLKSPQLWLSVALCLVIIFPIYWWNFENHFITYHYHGGRIGFWGKPDMDHILQQVLGSVFYNNPVNFMLYFVCLTALVKSKYIQLPDCSPLLLWLSFPLIGVLLWVSLFNETLPHWSGPAYLSLMLLAALRLDEQSGTGYPARWLKTAAWVYGSVLILGILCIRYLPFRIGSSQDKKLGTGDPTLDMTGWRSFTPQFESIYLADIKSGKMKPGSVILSDYWFPAGHLDHYLCKPFHHNLLVFGPLNNIHHFAWLNQRRPRFVRGSDAYFIYPSNYYGPPDSSLSRDFAFTEDSLLIPQFRRGIRVRNFVIYRMHDFRGDSLDYLIPGIR
jgi:Dolichyl-phosphate-mannose-protein mannosyltransferase